jgi:oligopeptide/dipeptide ABC transporter ATP-binding protein
MAASVPSDVRTSGAAVTEAPALGVSGLRIEFPGRAGSLEAVGDVGFDVRAGRTLGVVGESGCGKSLSLRAILGLVPRPGRAVDGAIQVGERTFAAADTHALAAIRGSEVGMVFQDPASSLNPVFSVGSQLTESLRLHQRMGRREAERRAVELLTHVGIPSAAKRLRDYPHQLSGGMRQRVMIAVAIAASPRVLLADEPTTALDVTIQDQILTLLRDLQAETGMAIVLVSHDLGVIAETADEVVVMYAGRVIERGRVRDVIDAPRHPYTRGLMSSLPDVEPGARRQRLRTIPGQPPDLGQKPDGCPFAPRCAHARDACASIPVCLDREPPAHGSACPFDAELPR